MSEIRTFRLENRTKFSSVVIFNVRISVQISDTKFCHKSKLYSYWVSEMRSSSDFRHLLYWVVCIKIWVYCLFLSSHLLFTLLELFAVKSREWRPNLPMSFWMFWFRLNKIKSSYHVRLEYILAGPICFVWIQSD